MMLKPRKSETAPPNDTKNGTLKSICYLRFPLCISRVSPADARAPCAKLQRKKIEQMTAWELASYQISLRWWTERCVSFVSLANSLWQISIWWIYRKPDAKPKNEKNDHCLPCASVTAAMRTRWYSRLVCTPTWCKKSNHNWDSIRTCHRTN